MSKDNFKKQKRLTQEEIDAIDNYGKPLKPQPELPSGGMGGKKGGMAKYKAERMPYREGAMEKPKTERMPSIGEIMEEPRMKPMPHYFDEEESMGLEAAAQGAAEGAAGEAVGRKKGGMSKKKMQDGGMVRGSGAAIKGLKKVRIY
jgi:hypothetical protein